MRFLIILIVLVYTMGYPMNAFSDKNNLSKVQKNQHIKNNESKLDVLDLKGMDVLAVLKLISQKTGVNIIANQNVKGKVTVYLRNVDVKQALNIIVDAYGWAFAEDNGVIKVMTAKDYNQKYGVKFGHNMQTEIRQLVFADVKDVIAILNQIKSSDGKVIADEKSKTIVLVDSKKKIQAMDDIIKKLDVPIETKVFSLSYATAEEISSKISEMLTPEVGKMRFDTRSNTIVVSDTSLKLKQIGNTIKAFDQKDKQVLIEAKIIQVALNDSHKMGIDWSAIVSDFHSLQMEGNYSILTDTDKKGKISIGTIASDDYQVLIEALETVGITDILSSPRITALNNKEAKILVGSTEPYVTTTTTTPSSGPTTTAESVNFIEVGVKLFVTPTIHEDNFITMKIKPEVSSVVKQLSTSNNNTIPVVETSQAETTVTVKDGVTIVIGGLIKEEKIRETKKIPILGDIPLLKFAFKNENDEVSKTELVIFITPNIITGDVSTDSPLLEDQTLYNNED